MAMSRKHYQAIAYDLRTFARANMTTMSYLELCRQMAITFKEDNTKFNREKFMDACEITG